jgi:cytochrome c oxidase subunit 4
MAHGAEEVREFTRRCTFVFLALMALTIVTVAVSYLQLDTPVAIAVGLTIAILKGSLVALFFMHLIDEKKVIYYTMALAASFFALVMYLPSGWDHDIVRTDSVWSVVPQEGSAGDHGLGHGNAPDEGHGADDGHGHSHGEEEH